MQAYCSRCNAQKELRSARTFITPKALPAVRGVCPTCGAEIVRRLVEGDEIDSGKTRLGPDSVNGNPRN